MRHLITSAVCMFIAIACVGCDTSYEESIPMKTEQGEPETPRLKLSDAINTTCPRSGMAVVGHSLTTYRGYTVGFCNQHCRNDFASDIEAAESDRAFFDNAISKLTN